MPTEDQIKLMMEWGMICTDPDCTATHVDLDHISFPDVEFVEEKP